MQKGEMKSEEMQGIILNIFKRKLFQEKSDLNVYDNILFGFHDGIVLTYAKRWFDFTPDGVDQLLDEKLSQKGIEGDWVKSFSEVYPIKILFPRKKCQKQIIDSYHFDFSYWEENANHDQPLFAALLMNTTKDFIVSTAQQNINPPTRRLFNVAKNIFEAIQSVAGTNAAKFMEKLHCGLFQCIGYYDYVLLFACTDWNLVYQIENKLKSWNVKQNEPEKSPVYFLFNNYLLLGMNARANALDNKPIVSNCEISVQINLREGCSAEGLQFSLLKQIKTERNEDSFQLWKENAQFYQINGGADCMIAVSSPGINVLLREFQSGGFLTPPENDEDNFYNKYILNIHTFVRRLLNGGKPEFPNGSQLLDETSKHLYKWLEDTASVEPFINDSTFSRRVHALQNQLARYQNIIGENHAFDIYAVLQPAYNTLYQNLNTLTDALNDTSAPDTDNLQFQADFRERFNPRFIQKRIYRLMDDFHNKVKHLQDVLQISDPHFIEGTRINHPSVGSSTKLLLTYNYLLNFFAEEIGKQVCEYMTKTGVPWTSSEYKFLLSCGGQDYAKAWNLSGDIPGFNAKTPKYRIDHNLIVMNMPERELLDIRGALLRLMHELWHFCGHRKRTIRCLYIIKDASYIWAKTIADVLFDWEIIKSDIFTRNLPYLLMNEHKLQVAESKLSKIFKATKQNFIDQIQTSLSELIWQGLNEPNPVYDFYYAERIFDRLKDVTADIFVNQSNKEKVLWKFIYDTYKDQCAALYQAVKLYQTVEESKVSLLIDEFLWKLEYTKTNNIIDHLTKTKIQKLLNIMAENNIISETAPSDNNNEAWIQIAINYSVDTIYDLLSSVYREAFSDNMACATVQCSKEEYILGFVSEYPTIEESLRPEKRRILRIGAILERKFLNENGEFELDSDALKQIYTEMYGTKNVQDRVSKIKESVNKIWSAYQTDKKYVKSLSDYLEQTEKVHKLENCNLESCKAIRNIFTTARHMTTHEGVLDIIQAFLHTWERMAQNK